MQGQLRGEVVIEDRRRHPAAAGDRLHRGAVIAAVREHVASRELDASRRSPCLGMRLRGADPATASLDNLILLRYVPNYR